MITYLHIYNATVRNYSVIGITIISNFLRILIIIVIIKFMKTEIYCFRMNHNKFGRGSLKNIPNHEPFTYALALKYPNLYRKASSPSKY